MTDEEKRIALIQQRLEMLKRRRARALKTWIAANRARMELDGEMDRLHCELASLVQGQLFLIPERSRRKRTG